MKLESFFHDPTHFVSMVAFAVICIALIIIYQSQRRQDKLLESTKESPIDLKNPLFDKHCVRVIEVRKNVMLVKVGGTDIFHKFIEPHDEFWAKADGFLRKPEVGETIKIVKSSDGSYSYERVTDINVFYGYKT